MSKGRRIPTWWMLPACGAAILVPPVLAMTGLLPQWIVIATPTRIAMAVLCGGVPFGLALILFPITRRLAAGPLWWLPLALLALGWIAWWNMLDPLGGSRGGYTFLNQGGLVSMAVGCVLGIAVNILALYTPVRPARDDCAAGSGHVG